jgi:hypothetical protein
MIFSLANGLNSKPDSIRAARPLRAASAVEAQRRALTGDGAEGIRPQTLKGFVLLWFPFGNFKVAVQQPDIPVFRLNRSFHDGSRTAT